MSDFKQAVEEIQCKSRSCGECMEHCPIFPCDPVRDASNAILSAHNAELDRIAEGMKLINTELDLGISQMFMFNRAKRRQLAEYQAYIKAQKGS